MNKYFRLLLFVAGFAALSFALPSTVLKFRPQQKQDNIGDIVKIFTKQSEPLDETLNQPIQYFKRLTIVPEAQLMKFKWSDCGNSSKIVFKSISVTPDPIVLPGTILVSMTIEIKEDISDNLEADVILKKKIADFYIDIPCIDNVGSCVYKNVCNLLNEVPKCPNVLIENNIPCHCPFKKGDYHLPSTGFLINNDSVPSGDYRLKVVLKDKGNNIGCLILDATFQHD